MRLIERLLQLMNELAFYRKRMLTSKPPQNIIRYVQSKAKAQEKSIPAFGSDSQGFGMDYAVTHSFSPAPIGPREGVPKPIVNRSGSLADLRPAYTEKGYVDPSISRTFSRSSEGTNLKPSPCGKSPLSSWDGKVRLKEKSSSSPMSFRQKSQPTPADQHEQDMKNWDFNFLA